MNAPDDGTRLQARLLAAIGDELRAPVSTIIGLCEQLGGGLAPDPQLQAEYQLQILGKARQLLHLINSLVELARAEAGQLELRPQPADLASLVDDAVHFVGAAAARRGVEFAVDLSEAPPRVVLDAPRIMHALNGLLSGALDLAAGRKIGLRIVPEGQHHVRLEVTGLDIGPGQTGEFMIPSPGAWLGLALARSIVEAHGGSVGFGGPPGRRRTLHAVLPGVAPG